MTSRELKTEINKVLDNVPENQLEDVLAYLQEIQKGTLSENEDSAHLKKIMEADRELLRKLAE